MMKRAGLAILLIVFFVTLAPAQGRGNRQAAPATPEEKPEEGIPVTDPLVIAQCGTCHTKDDRETCRAFPGNALHRKAGKNRSNG